LRAHALEKKALIIKYIRRPKLFEVKPFADVMDSLVKTNEKQLAEKEREARKFLSEHRFHHAQNVPQGQIKWFPEDSAEKGPTIKSLKEAKETIDFSSHIIAHTANRPKMEPVWKVLYEAACRGVIVRVVMNKPESGKLLKEISFSVAYACRLFKHKNFLYRYCKSPIDTHITIMDDKETFIYTEVITSFDQYPLIWTNIRSLVNLVKNYFSAQWEMAEEPHRIAAKDLTPSYQY
jgi:hypothetical protein